MRENYELMRAGEVWQPRPYPNRCVYCGGIGFLYVQIIAPRGHQQEGQRFDAVQPCSCRPVAPPAEPKSARNKRG